MMNKVDQFSSILVDKHKISQEEADKFVSVMFSVISEKLEEEKLVKVKGLGTFKLTEMNARESVNINTGERITIEGRYKLTFTPENAVRDRINAPFSQFESIDLDTDIDFTSIDEKYGTTYEPETEATEVVSPMVPLVQVPAEEPAAEEPVAEEPVAEEPVAEEPVAEEPVAEEPVAEEPVAEEPVAEEPVAEEPVAEEPVAEEPVVEEPVAEEPVAEEPVAEEPVAEEPEEEEYVEEETETVKSEEKLDTVRSPFCENLIREELEHSHKIIRLLKTVIFLIVILLLAVGCYFGYHFWKNSQANATQSEKKEVVEQTPQKPAEQPVTTANPAEQPVTEAPAEVKEEKERTTETPAVTTSPEEEIYNKDARVRTGAYRIVGLDTTVTVLKGQTFKSICKAHLGEGMECYVEVFNGGIKKVSAGDTLKIPKVELKKKTKK